MVSYIDRVKAQFRFESTTTQNYGIKGGKLFCIFWVHKDGDPTGVTESRWVP